MFANHRHHEAGQSPLIAVAAILAVYLFSAGLLMKDYTRAPTRSAGPCQVVCNTPAADAQSPGRG